MGIAVVELEAEAIHALTAHGYIACRGLQLVRAVRQRLGYRVTPLSGDPVLDAERVTCPECRAALGIGR